MSVIGNLFNVILYQPLFNALVFLYDVIPGHDFGLAIIVLTIIVRFALYPLMAQSIRSQKVMSELQPKIQEIQKKYANDKAQQTRATMELYQKEKFNPFGGCLPLIVQLPILLALYRVFWKGFQPEQLNLLYGFVPHPASINPLSFGLINLSQSTTAVINNATHLIWPNIILVLLAGITQFIQAKMLQPKTGPQKVAGQTAQITQTLQNQMIYLFPLFTVFILWRFSAALALYWTVGNIFSIIQQYIIYRPKKQEVQKA